MVAGLTTFLTMAYIIFVQPAVLGAAGMDFERFCRRHVSSTAFATALMAFLANYPDRRCPGDGPQLLFAYSVVVGMKVPWQIALGAVALAGLTFILAAGFGPASVSSPQFLLLSNTRSQPASACSLRWWASSGQVSSLPHRHPRDAWGFAHRSTLLAHRARSHSGDDGAPGSGRLALGHRHQRGHGLAVGNRALSGLGKPAAITRPDAPCSSTLPGSLLQDARRRVRVFPSCAVRSPVGTLVGGWWTGRVDARRDASARPSGTAGGRDWDRGGGCARHLDRHRAHREGPAWLLEAGRGSPAS